MNISFCRWILLWLVTISVVTAAEQTALSKLPECAVSHLCFLQLRVLEGISLTATATLSPECLRYEYLFSGRPSMHLYKRSLPK